LKTLFIYNGILRFYIGKRKRHRDYQSMAKRGTRAMLMMLVLSMAAPETVGIEVGCAVGSEVESS
jgi:hypothetical protein